MSDFNIQFEEQDQSITLEFEQIGGGAVKSVNGKTGVVVLDAGDLEYDDTETYSSGSVGDELSTLKDGLLEVAERGQEIDGIYAINNDDFEIGNITISGTGWVYSNSTTRVRTKEGTTIHLENGDVIGLTSYADARFYIGVRRSSDGGYEFGGWKTADFTCTVTGDYVLLLCHSTDKVLEDKYELLDLLIIRKNTSFVQRAETDIGNAIKVDPVMLNQSVASSNGWADVTDLPVNAVYSISNNIPVSFGVPVSSYAVLTKISASKSNNFCVYLYNKYPLDSEMYYAITYSDTIVGNIVWNKIPKMGDFTEFIRSIKTAVLTSNYTTVLPDANTATNNTIYRIFINPNVTMPISNMPISVSQAFMHTLITVGDNTTYGYRVQIYLNDANEWAYRFGYGNGTWEAWKVYSANTSYVYINADDDDIIQKWIDAYNIGTTDIFFGSGTYDVIAMYKEHFGNDYFDNYTGYSSGGNAWGRGLKLGNNIHYHFNANSEFVANYDGTNTAVKQYFSMFASDLVNGGFTVEGLNITACSGLRYAIHHDFGLNTATGQNATYRNCTFTCADRAIGAGLRNGDILCVENCIFETTDTDCINVHIPSTSGYYGKVIVSGCYMNNRLGLSNDWISSNTTKSTALITNNSYSGIDSPTTFNVTAFNNAVHN